jgi:hypothetical protein
MRRPCPGDIDESFGVLGRELHDFGLGAQQKDAGVDVVLSDGRAVVQRGLSGADTEPQDGRVRGRLRVTGFPGPGMAHQPLQRSRATNIRPRTHHAMPSSTG